MKYAEIVVNVPLTVRGAQETLEESLPAPYAWLEQAFTYNVPSELENVLCVGQLVWVPFGARRLQGIVVGLRSVTALAKTRAVETIVETQPLLSSSQIELARWISQRYLAPLPECVWLMLPPGIEEKVGTIYKVSDLFVDLGELTDKQRALFELVREKGDLKSTHLPPNLRSAAEILAMRGFLIKRAHVKPSKSKPKRVTTVRLVALREEIERALAKLERRNVRAEIIAVLAQLNAPIALDELCARVNCASRSVRALANAGVVEITESSAAFSLTPKYFETLPALPPMASRVLVFLREHGHTAAAEEIHSTTHATPATLRALQERGLIQKAEQREQVRLVGAPPVFRSSSRLSKIIEFLQREGGAVWISAVYVETGASLQDLKKLERAGIVRLETEEMLRDPLAGTHFAPQSLPTLTAEQARAFAEIQQGLESNAPRVYLLHGVTGSGKTEVYLRAIEEVLKQGKQAIALVPEIALTPQTVQRFGARLGPRIGVIHSELSYGERYDTWRRARDGKIDVVIGPRSAVFAPLPRLGLIVMDEEHESSYKSDPDLHQPSYHTREVALELARLHNASVIFGTATPDVETYWRTRAGEFKLLELPQRILAHGSGDTSVQYQELPPVEVVDLRAELRAGNTSVFSHALATAVRETLAAHAQVILFLNRRGMATAVLCRECGQAVQCPRCNNSYTVHQSGAESARELICHHCGKRGKIPRTCPNCGSTRIRALGLGTEKLEQLVRETFRARTLRWDWDVTRRKDSHEKILDAFTRGDADVLIGTQMIAKGLDLPRVTLVGVVNADTGLNLPDFRAGERTFQLLTQVAGRAGRSALGGKVVIQTYHPEHYAIVSAARHDYAEFYEQELRFRRESVYPPFKPLARLLFTNVRESVALESSARLASALQDRIRRQGLLDVELVGPAPAFFAKFGGRYRYHMLLRGHDVRALLSTFPLPPGWRVDVDPVNML